MVRYGGGIDAPDIGDDGGGSDGGGDGDGGGGDGGGGGGVDVDFGGGGIDAPNIGDDGGGDGSQAGGGIDAPDPGGVNGGTDGGDGSQAGGGIDAPDPGGDGGDPDGSQAGGGIDAPDIGDGPDGSEAGGGIDAPDPGGVDTDPSEGAESPGGIDAPNVGNGGGDGQQDPDPGDVQDPTPQPQPPGGGPATIEDPEPVQGVETVTGAGGDVGDAFDARAIEQQVLENNPNLSAEDVRIQPDGTPVLTTTGEAVFAEQARQRNVVEGGDIELGREATASTGVEGGDVRLFGEAADQRGVEGGDIELAREAAEQRGIEGGDVRLFGEAAQQARDAEAEAARREIGPDGGPTFTLPGLNIEAQAGDLGMGQQAADFRPTQDFERQDLGDEFIQGTIPGPFEFGGLNGGGAVIDFPGAGREIEPFLGEEARAFSTFAEEVGTGVEEAIPIPGLGGAAGQTARGVTETVNPAGLALTGIETAETGAFLAGGLPDVSVREFESVGGFGEGGPIEIDADAGEFFGRAQEVGGQAGPTAVQAGEFVQENPFQATGMLAAGAAGGIAAGRAIESLPNLARAGRIRAQGGDIFDVEDLSDPPETTMGTLPRFTDPAVDDPNVAVREFQRQAAGGELSEQLGQPTVFSGRAGEDVAEFGGFGRQFDAPEGGAEIPGLFFAADLSPLRLPGATESGLSVPRPGLPRPRIRQARVAAEVDPEVQRMPGDVRTLDEAGTFMRTEADPEGLFVRSEQLITPEQEAIAPPGAGFAGEDIFGIRVGGTSIPFTDRTFGGEIVTGRTFRRTEGGDVDIGEAAIESTEAMQTIRRAQQRAAEGDRISPAAPSVPTAPTAPTVTDPFGFGTPTTAPTTPTELFGTTTPTLTQPTSDVDSTAPSEATAPSSPTSVSSPFGSVPVSSGAPSAPPTQPTSAPPSEPPSSPPSAPPSAPPSGPPPSGPPSGPPSEPPTIPGMPPTGPPPSRPPTFFDPETEPVSRDEPERRPPPPEGQQFENPIASGFQFLFGRGTDDVGTASPFGDMQSPFGDLGGE